MSGMGPENQIGLGFSPDSFHGEVGSGDYWFMHKTHGIVRVFPRKTSMTPTDPFAFVGYPPMAEFRPPKSYPVRVSVAFTWDKDKGVALRDAWSQYYDDVSLGGPAFAFDNNKRDFWQSIYLKQNVIITSTGCNFNCPWCLVPEREGKLRELNGGAPAGFYIKDDIYVQDNNFLQCSRRHQEKVFKYLQWCSKDTRVQFTGGLDSDLINDWFVDYLGTIKVRQVFFACDTKEQLQPLRKAIKMLNGLSRDRIRCYVLLAFNNETISESTARLEDVFNAGALPFAQLYQPPEKLIKYPQEWRDLARAWSRPAITKAIMKLT